MQVLRMDIDALANDPRNARSHNERSVQAIAESLRAFGQQKPLVITSDGVVLAGNGTLMAARRLGWTHVEVLVTELPEAEARAYALADNRSTELSDWDEQALAAELASLDRSLALLVGFDAIEIDDLLAPPAVASPDTRADIRAAQRGATTIRLLLRVQQVQRFEQAMTATGLRNRAHALLAIAEHYLETAHHGAGQFDVAA